MTLSEPIEASLKSKLKKASGTAAVANYERDRAGEIAATGGFDGSFPKLMHAHCARRSTGRSADPTGAPPLLDCPGGAP